MFFITRVYAINYVMSNKKHTLIVLACLVGAPILFFILGGLSSIFFNKLRPQYVGTGPGLGAALMWTALGFFAFILSLVCGPIVSYLYRAKGKSWLPVMGYLIPPALAIVVGIIGMIITFLTIDQGA